MINELLFKLFHPFFAPCTKKDAGHPKMPRTEKGLLITLQSGYNLASVARFSTKNHDIVPSNHYSVEL